VKNEKTILIIALSLLLITAVITPVLAAPINNEKKVPVSLQWKNVGPTTVIERRDVDTGISHRTILQNWAVKLYIDGAVIPLEGTAVINRKPSIDMANQSSVVDQIVNDYYTVSFSTAGGGFEGNVHIVLASYVSITTYDIMVHAIPWN
jgi:hypothetical protein